jgi:methionyl-tRNA formyltransferase
MEPDKLDCGNIITQEKMALDNKTYIGDIYKWAEEKIPKLFVQSLTVLESDPSYVLKYADSESEESFRCYPRRVEDSRIDWKLSADAIHKLIRCSAEPFAGAFGFFHNEKIIIWRAELYHDNERYCAVPGQISLIDKKGGSVVIITGGGKLKLTDIEYGNYRGSPARVIKSIRNRIE